MAASINQWFEAWLTGQSSLCWAHVQWTTFTPDGLRVVVTRQQDGWSVVCGDSEGAQHELLNVALIEAIRRAGPDFAGHAMQVDYAAWTRELADQIQSEDAGKGSRRRRPL
jgi:hypothetical protein